MLDEKLDKIRARVKGKKTYSVSLAAILIGLYIYFTGEMPTFDNPSPLEPTQGLKLLFDGLIGTTLRAAIG